MKDLNFHYLSAVHLRKKILSYFLLTIYLLVVSHQSVSPSNTEEFVDTPKSKTSHQHEDFKEVHHEHHFHIGIFHFFGHLFEAVNHSNDLANEHLIFVHKTSPKKVVNHNQTFNFYTSETNPFIFSVGAESLSAPPPYHLFLLHRLKQPNTPLRAPPAFV